MPVGYVWLGYSVMALNPLYGQGMTSTGAQADWLARTVGELAAASADVTDIAETFIERQAELLAKPWARVQLSDTIFSEAMAICQIISKNSGHLPRRIVRLGACWLRYHSLPRQRGNLNARTSLRRWIKSCFGPRRRVLPSTDAQVSPGYLP